jgi:predicted ATPase
VFKVLSQIDRPVKIHRLSGLQSILIGREKEMAVLSKAVDGLKHGEGKIVSICGEAGTGKSRLIRDFKATLDLDQIQWREGHSYEYSRSMPFYPLIDLLSRAFRIDENASPGTVRKRVESGVSTLLGKNYPGTPYIGGLFSLSNTEVEEVSPEYWKSRLYDAVQQLLEAFTAQKPSVICFEDLHWADPSFIELLIFLLRNTSSPTFFLCVFRPSFSHFNDIEINKSIFPVEEIRLQDLSANNAIKMLKSLLKSDHLPNELTEFLQQKTEGNPFYIEEVINSLIESDVLICEDKVWRLKGTITEQDIPSSIQGVLSARIDRLEENPKRLLQEASVIGRAFFYEILCRITEINVPIHEDIKNLERLDLIRERSIDPDLEYIFKHALSQEIVYNGVLKIERRKIHERIGITIEKLFETNVHPCIMR